MNAAQVEITDEAADQRAILSAIRDAAAKAPSTAEMLATVVEYVDTLDERHRTIVALYRRGKFPSEIARMLNEEPQAIRAALGKIFVDLRFKVLPGD